MMQHFEAIASKLGDIENGGFDVGGNSIFLDQFLPDPNGLGFGRCILLGPISDLGKEWGFFEALDLFKPEALRRVEAIPIRKHRMM